MDVGWWATEAPFQDKGLAGYDGGHIIIRDGGKGYVEGVRAFLYGPD